MIVHLNGWPGVGKETIGAVLAERIGAKFIPNHLLHDVAIRCAGLRDPARWDLYEAVRVAAYRALAGRPSEEVLVMTNALCDRSEREVAAWNHVVDLAMARRVPLVPVVLTVSLQENARRVRSPGRFGRKLADPAVLRSLYAQDTIQQPNVPDLLMLDATDRTPTEAAEAIALHLAALPQVAGAAEPATDRHRRLRLQAVVPSS